MISSFKQPCMFHKNDLHGHACDHDSDADFDGNDHDNDDVDTLGPIIVAI